MARNRQKKRHARGAGGFVMLPHYLLKSAAWLDLDSNSRALYIELLFRFNGSNNGSIGLAAREAGKALHVSKDTAARAFDALISHGLIVLASDSTFDQKRLSREWLLTDHPDDRNGRNARKDFMRWGSEKQNIGAPQGQIGAPQGLCGNGVSKKSGYRRTTGTVIGPSPSLQSHVRDTYISAIPTEPEQGSADLPEPKLARSQSVSPHTRSDATARSSAYRKSDDGPFQVSEALAAILRKEPSNG